MISHYSLEHCEYRLGQIVLGPLLINLGELMNFYRPLEIHVTFTLSFNHLLIFSFLIFPFRYFMNFQNTFVFPFFRCSFPLVVYPSFRSAGV